jgi:hypothetical protein
MIQTAMFLQHFGRGQRLKRLSNDFRRRQTATPTLREFLRIYAHELDWSLPRQRPSRVERALGTHAIHTETLAREPDIPFNIAKAGLRRPYTSGLKTMVALTDGLLKCQTCFRDRRAQAFLHRAQRGLHRCSYER